jgi:hypothetical protein
MFQFAWNEAMREWGGHWPHWAIVIGLIVPLIPFGVGLFLCERTFLSRGWLMSKFRLHPISTSAIICILLWIACSQALRILARSHSSPERQSEKLSEQKPSYLPEVTTSVNPSSASTPHALSTIKPTTQSPKKLKPIATTQAPATNPSLSQEGNDNQQIVQTMTNSPGGMQAGRDITVFGPIPKPSRTLNPDDVNRAVALLSQAKNEPSIIFITYPTNAREGGEISTFTHQLQNVFIKAGWMAVQERNLQIGLFVGRTDGIGCSSPSNPTPESQLAMKALSILHYPCTHPSIFDEADEVGNSPVVNALYVTVGTRIVSEQ